MSNPDILERKARDAAVELLREGQSLLTRADLGTSVGYGHTAQLKAFAKEERFHSSVEAALSDGRGRAKGHQTISPETGPVGLTDPQRGSLQQVLQTLHHHSVATRMYVDPDSSFEAPVRPTKFAEVSNTEGAPLYQAFGALDGDNYMLILTTCPPHSVSEFGLPGSTYSFVSLVCFNYPELTVSTGWGQGTGRFGHARRRLIVKGDQVMVADGWVHIFSGDRPVGKACANLEAGFQTLVSNVKALTGVKELLTV
ncbi:MAG: hypothetical protein WC777_00805 [Candidatus Gracilibacteria bacterium]|jgi:hypothetical protein